MRLIIDEVILDQKRLPGQVWMKIVWQTGATSEHRLQRRVRSYGDYIDIARLRERVTKLNAAGKMDQEIAATLNAGGFIGAGNRPFRGGNIWMLRQRWDIPTVKINGAGANPDRWPDGAYSVQGAATALGVTSQTVFKYLARGILKGRQSTKWQPWQIELTDCALARNATGDRGERHHDIIGDPAMTLAAVDRLVHHATIFELNVESYRRRQAIERKRGPGRPPTQATPANLAEADLAD